MIRRKDKILRITGGSIVTMDTSEPVVGEVVVGGGRIVWSGRRGSAPAAYNRARAIDLKGRLLLPAFSDAHTHFLLFAQMLSRVDLGGVPTLRATLARIKRHVQAAGTGRGWIIGNGFDVNLWGDHWPTRRDLDRVTGGRPAGIWSHDCHAFWVNSEALRRARITRETPDPPGGQIVRDTDGEPTGILLEEAYSPITDCIPNPSPAGVERLINTAQARAHEAGVTAIGDMGPAATLAGFSALKAKGKLRLRLWKSIALVDLDRAIALGLRSGFGDAWIKIGAVKIFSDGALGSQTAWMYSPYAKDRKNRGICRISRTDLETAVRRATRHGLSVCVHAIGDAAVGQTIDVMLQYESQFPRHQPPRIEHLQLFAPRDIARLAGSRIIASMQPSHLLTDRDYADRHWGRRSRHTLAFRSLWDRGVTLAFGSDVPIERLAPLEGIGAAVHRARPDDRRGPWHPRERLSVWEAVWGFTVGAAVAAGDGHFRGKIAPGYVADLVVLDRNIFTIPAPEIFATQVEMTLVDGEVVRDV